MKFDIVKFCTYHSQNGLTIVNATNKILRLRENDGTIAEIPSSVLPNGELPELYKEKARELHMDIAKEDFNASIFINIKAEEFKVRNCVYQTCYKTSDDSVREIIKLIDESALNRNLIIVGSTEAAKNYGMWSVVEPTYIEDGTIRGDYFKLYR